MIALWDTTGNEVVKALAACEGLRPVLCLTGQHRDMLAGILARDGRTWRRA